MGNTFEGEIEHLIVFSSGGGMRGFKMENRHRNESVWGFGVKEGEKKKKWVRFGATTHSSLTTHCCVTEGFCTGIQRVTKTSCLIRQKVLFFWCAVVFLKIFSMEIKLFDAQISWATSPSAGGTKSREVLSAVAVAFAMCHICWASWWEQGGGQKKSGLTASPLQALTQSQIYAQRLEDPRQADAKIPSL